MRSALTEAAAATVVAELAYTRAEADVDAVVVTPLTEADDVIVALPYADRALGEALAHAEAVALVSSDERLTLAGWQPLAAVGRMDVEADPDGARFRAALVEEELRKHPPSRLLANSLMARREHWWYMPRLLCRLVDVRVVRPVAPRSGPEQGVVAWRSPDGLAVETVAAEPLGERSLRLRCLDGGTLAAVGDPACLLRHDYSVPDLERRTMLREHGRLEGDVLRVAEQAGRLRLPPPPGLLTRVRQHRALARACQRELARERG